ncbi:vanadium-dependent haloperoxidase [Fibrella aquatilis]|uniref:Vanadium-dependent haloperoxidase n=1 Tax=Fibrella aquatilis TaxID=2817059 RepID=A0A939GCR1_9BACT|nr:vanadium-dependent haloperoxidase [Fibrella aquatilis]MBO0933993.1 vanadium-dependent haloperoxidase [Fibrella aquatilis]
MKHLLLCSLLAVLLGAGCSAPKKPPLTDSDVATAWADMTLRLTKTTPANTPTYASRCLGYIGLTMYESVVPGYPAYRSLEGQLNGLDSLPKPETGKPYNWVLALNAGQAYILQHIYNQTSDENKHRVDSLAQVVADQFAEDVDKEIITQSVEFGQAVAERVFAWSKTDGGHRGYLKNFDKTMTYPDHLGCWKPPLYAQSFSHYPLHPHWGKNRTFLAQDARIPAPARIPYSTDKSSAYYQQFLQVYEKEKTLTQTEKEIAIWWSDDPDETFTPPGHSYYMATLAVRKAKPSLIRAAETYARVGMAVADAFIDCWKWKFQFFTERPNTFVPQHIDQQWDSFWPDPPFPAFPSGHAIQAGATATVLTDLYGNQFAFADSAHVGRKPDRLRQTKFKARQFTSFRQAAQEIADSRFYGGIHTPQDNQAGLEKGDAIGLNINRLNWKR